MDPWLFPLAYTYETPRQYVVVEEEDSAGECQLGVRPSVPFLAPNCEAFQTGPRCCRGTETFVRCHTNGEDGMSYGDVYCLP